MDNAVGKIIESLRENGLYENSIIVFTSDVSNHFLDIDFFANNFGSFCRMEA